MVRSLKKLLNDSCPVRVDVVASVAPSDYKHQSSKRFSQHIELIKKTNLSYSLKRGAGSSSSQHETSSSDQSPFICLSKHLEYVLLGQRDGMHQEMIFASIQIDQIMRTLLRLLNDRVSTLWRMDQHSSNVHDACYLLDDVHSLYKLFDLLSLSLDRISTEKNRKDMKSSLRSIKLLELKHLSQRMSNTSKSRSKSIQQQFYDLQSTVLPKIILRIEKYMTFYITLESQKVCSLYLKRDSFLVSSRTIFTKKYPSERQPHISTALIEVLERNLLKYSIEMLTKNNFLLVLNILSKNFNVLLKCILLFILNKKYKFNQDGIHFLYVIIQNFQLWILDVKKILLKNESCHINPFGLKIILDKGPWTYANLILNILQTGKVETLNINPMIQKNCTIPISYKNYFYLNTRFSGTIFPETISDDFNSENMSINSLNRRKSSDLIELPIISYDHENKKNNKKNNISMKKNNNGNKNDVNKNEEKTNIMQRNKDNSNNNANIASKSFLYFTKYDRIDDVRKCIILDFLRIFYNSEENDKIILNSKNHEKLIEKECSAWIALSIDNSKEDPISFLLFYISKHFFSFKKSSISIDMKIDVNRF